MRRLFVGVVLALLVLAGPGLAAADSISVSLDVPVVYSFSDATLTDASPSGVLIGVQLPLLFNIGVESYKVSGQASTNSFDYTVVMADLFFEIPFPAANLVLGAGLGQGKFKVPAASVDSSATLAQLYFSLGIPFAGVFDGHVGYHRIFGEADYIPGSKVNLDAGMATVGVKLGF